MSTEAAAPPRSSIATLFPGSFALVMATGIVSIAAQQQGFEVVADALFAVNAIFYMVLWGLTIVRVARFPRLVLADLKSHQRGAGFLTIVAATNVLGSQIALRTTWTGLAFALWILGIVAWLGLTYAFLTAVTVSETKPGFEQGIGGAWLLLVVSTESIAVLGALLAPSVDPTHGVLLVALLAHLVGLMLYVLVIGLIFYRWTFFPLTGEQVTPPYWINMGALAITTVAGANLLLASGSWSVLKGSNRSSTARRSWRGGSPRGGSRCSSRSASGGTACSESRSGTTPSTGPSSSPSGCTPWPRIGSAPRSTSGSPAGSRRRRSGSRSPRGS